MNKTPKTCVVGNVKIEFLNVITDDDRLDEELQEVLVTRLDSDRIFEVGVTD